MIDDEEQDATQAIANEGSVEKERYEEDVLRDKVYAPYTEWRRSQETAATRRSKRAGTTQQGFIEQIRKEQCSSHLLAK